MPNLYTVIKKVKNLIKEVTDCKDNALINSAKTLTKLSNLNSYSTKDKGNKLLCLITS